MPSAARLLSASLLPVLAVLPARAEPAGWSVAPAGGGRPSFYVEGAPGTVQQDTLAITNRGARPVTVGLYGTGVRVTFAEPDPRPHPRPRVRVPARTRAAIPFTVAVPTGAAPGDRGGTITARADDGRVATVPVHLRVAGPALSALTVEHLTVGSERITYELVNRGTTALVPQLAVQADGVLGRVLDRPARTLPVTLPPGRRLHLSEAWRDRPVLDAVDVRLTVTAAGGARDSASATARFVPWGLIGAGAGSVSAAGTVMSLVVRRRGRRVPPAGALDGSRGAVA